MSEETRDTSSSWLSPEEEAYLKIISDPVLWAKSTMGWEAREYQEEILRDPGKRIVLRMSRRSGKTDVMVIKALYHAFIQPGGNPDRDYRILLIAPLEDQIVEFFGRMRELIRKSPDLMESVIEDKKNPNLIVFGNRSRIRGVTAGTKSGAKAMAVRGKGADMILYDEMDYLSDDDIANSYAITQEHPDIYVVGASTPTGNRGWFYRWCTDSRAGFKEYHIRAEETPQWNEQMERDLKLQFSGVKYLQEVEAEFGEEQAGVIQKKHIDAAIIRGEQLGLRYQSIEAPEERRGPRILGVDWDKYGAATHMIGLEFDETNRLYYPIFYHEVAKHRFTLTQAIRDIVTSDEAFFWDHIIVDRGYGDTQLEELHRYGILHPETGLAERVEGVQYWEHVKVYDPFTQKRSKQPLKPFMISQFSLAFENQKFALVPDDDKMRKHLEDFRVIAISDDRRPKFSGTDDHLFLAMAQAYYGYVKHFSDLITLKPVTTILPFRSPFRSSLEEGVRRDLKAESTDSILSSSFVSGTAFHHIPKRKGSGGGRELPGDSFRRSF